MLILKEPVQEIYKNESIYFLILLTMSALLIASSHHAIQGLVECFEYHQSHGEFVAQYTRSFAGTFEEYAKINCKSYIPETFQAQFLGAIERCTETALYGPYTKLAEILTLMLLRETRNNMMQSEAYVEPMIKAITESLGVENNAAWLDASLPPLLSYTLNKIGYETSFKDKLENLCFGLEL